VLCHLLCAWQQVKHVAENALRSPRGGEAVTRRFDRRPPSGALTSESAERTFITMKHYI
jgi:hypothetical protein